MNDRRRWIFFVALVLLGSCIQSRDWWSGSEAGAAEQGRAVLTAPAVVLDGTDLVELDDLRRADLPSRLEGTYHAEQGGAELWLSITAGSGDQVTVTRTYEEPGTRRRSQGIPGRAPGSRAGLDRRRSYDPGHRRGPSGSGVELRLEFNPA